MQIIKSTKLFFAIAVILLITGCARKITPVKDEPLPQVIKPAPVVDTAAIIRAALTMREKELSDERLFMKDSAIIKNYPTSEKYARSNSLYQTMIDSMVNVIREYPLIDSAGLPYSSEWVGTPNMGLRRPNYVIIHHTSDYDCSATLKEFTTHGRRQASAHYVICKDGTVYHMLNDLLRAHHAGDSKWGNTTDLNSSSIGIELDNDGDQPFTGPQLNSLITLLSRLKSAYKVPVSNFIGHGDVAPKRKNDPNWRFPWKELSEKGFGLWWDDTTGITVPENFDYVMALRIVGYDVSELQAAVISFKRHFMQDINEEMTPAAIKILFALYRKYYY
jgi:N-acetylmuramoyl-L-alanine amidase